MNKKILFILVVGLIIIGVGTFFMQRKDTSSETITPPTVNKVKKLKVVATFYPLEHFSKQVGGETIELVTLTHAGGEPHDYEPTAQEIIKIKNADVFVLNGAGLEPWTEKLIPQLTTEKVKVLNMSGHVELFHAEEHEEENHEGEEHEHEHGEFDPHIWLDPVRARAEVNILRDTFISLDPVNADTYRQNAATYLNELTLLEKSFQQGLSSCVHRQIVTSHNAFQYLASRYNFTVYGLAGLSPSEGPSPKHMADLTELVKSQKIKYIFTETLASPKVTETLAKEAKVGTLVLNPLEGLTEAEIQQGKNYESVMKENLQNLRTAMECK